MYTSSFIFANYSYLHRNSIGFFSYYTSPSPFIRSLPNSAFTKHCFHAEFVSLWQTAKLDTCSANVFSSNYSLQITEFGLSTLQAVEDEQRARRHSARSNTQLGTSRPFRCHIFLDKFYNAYDAPFDQKEMITTRSDQMWLLTVHSALMQKTHFFS